MKKSLKIKPNGRLATTILVGSLAAAFTGFVGVAYHSLANASAELKVPTISLGNSEIQPLDNPNEKVVAKEVEEPSNSEVEEKPVEEQSETQETETKLEEVVENTANDNAATATPDQSGTCWDWMARAGITDQANAYKLIMRESSCNPNAVNRYSGACGIGQQLPCGKWEHQWNDPVGAMIDMQKYVFSRYGSWANALRFHYAHNWY